MPPPFVPSAQIQPTPVPSPAPAPIINQDCGYWLIPVPKPFTILAGVRGVAAGAGGNWPTLILAAAIIFAGLMFGKGINWPLPVPTPIPSPVNPTPKPPPAPVQPPAPFASPGLAVLIVEDKTAHASLPAGQREIIDSTKAGSVRDYLKTAAATIDGVPAWHVLDKDDQVNLDNKVWQDAFAVPRLSVPWIVVSTGKTGFSQPLPQSAAELLAMLKKLEGK